ncbi:MAG: RICIN domain-containing protein [Polyangiaceae bacterium]
MHKKRDRISQSTTVAMLAVGLLAAFSAPARAAIQQDLYSYHLGFNFGVEPQVDHHANLLTLIDISDVTHLVKFGPNANTTIWDVVMPGTGSEVLLNNGCHILIDANDNVYVNSFFDDRLVRGAVVVTKINSNGTIAWGGPKVYAIGAIGTSEHFQPGPMAFGSDGSLYVVARTGQNENSPQPTTLLRLDPSTGAERNRLAVAASNDFTRGMADTALATDSGGNVYYGGPQGLWSFSQDLRQTPRWASSLVPRSMAVDSANGALFVTGVGTSGTQIYKMFVARLATSSGAPAWTWSSNGEAYSTTYPYTSGFIFMDDRNFGGNKIALDSAGQVYAVGHALQGRYEGGIITKFDKTTGANLWLKTYGGEGEDQSLYALAIDNLNHLYVSGHESSADDPSQASLADLQILSPVDGSLLWSAPDFELGGFHFTDEAIDSVVVDGNGNTYWKATYESSDGGDGQDIFQFRGNALPDGTYTIVGLNSAMALDDPGSSTAAGTQMDQWTVNNGANQKWTITNQSYNTLRLVNQASGRSLGVRGNSLSNGAAVEQNVWTGANSQQWVVSSTGTLGYFTLKNLNSGQVLDVVGASKSAGALIDQWPGSGGANQAWNFR